MPHVKKQEHSGTARNREGHIGWKEIAREMPIETAAGHALQFQCTVSNVGPKVMPVKRNPVHDSIGLTLSF
jgi:hypothetical protein